MLSVCCVSAVKPMSPQVFNITYNEEGNQAKIWIRTPYHKDYLTVDNQLFQFQIRTAEKTMVLGTKISPLQLRRNDL